MEATRFQNSRITFFVSAPNTNFCTDEAVPQHRNVFSLASSSMVNRSAAGSGNLEGLV